MKLRVTHQSENIRSALSPRLILNYRVRTISINYNEVQMIEQYR